jgi:hypothetical protein
LWFSEPANRPVRARRIDQPGGHALANPSWVGPHVLRRTEFQFAAGGNDDLEPI